MLSQRSRSNTLRKSHKSVKPSDNLNLSNTQSSVGSYSRRSRVNSERRKKPKFSELGVLKRNQDFLAAKQRKLTAEREKKKQSETVGCTFEPKINKYKPKHVKETYTPRSNVSLGGQSNRSYSDIHKDRINKKSN